MEKEKKGLELIREEIIVSNPELLNIAQHNMLEEFFSYNLWFRHEERACQIYYYGDEPNPRYIFKWDDCPLLTVYTSNASGAGTLIKKWVVDKAMPSVLSNEFPEVHFDPLAAYYEQGDGITGEFIIGWDLVEDSYKDVLPDKAKEILQLIREMRARGFDKTLRAGTSLYSLVLSRSRRYGLRLEQKSIRFEFTFIKTAMEVWTFDRRQLPFDKIAYNDTIDQLLRELEHEPID
jgi:hypothetical protein